MAVPANQLTFFKDKPAPKPRKAAPKALARGEFEPINPLDLAQDSALWLTGQRSIEAQRGGYPVHALKWTRDNKTQEFKWVAVTLTRGARYVPASVRHPGKMQPAVAGAIIDTYTKPGWRIIDCMGGIGTTGVEGAERGRHVVCVELVRHWANVAHANALRTAYRGAPGTMQVIHGDARRLPELLAGAADAAVFSPPYGEALEERSGRMEGRAERLAQIIRTGRPIHGNWHFGPGQQAMMAPAYQADAVVTSPPYAETNLTPEWYHGLHLGRDPGDVEIKKARQSTTAIGYDAAVFSPPYGPAEGNGGGRGLEAAPPKESEWAAYEQGKGPSPGWQGYQARAYVPANADAVITSPAYGDIRQDGGAHQFGDGSAMTNYTGEARVIQRGRDKTNVGNLKYGSMDKALAIAARLMKGEAIPDAEWPDMQYLESMTIIYRNCWLVLKPGRLCILVLKDYRRNKARVNLVGDTIRLMEAVGFTLHDRALALTSKIEGGQVITKVSPFVRLNARKPEKNGGKVLLPAGEEVLVFRKE